MKKNSEHHISSFFPLALGWIILLILVGGAFAYTYHRLDAELDQTTFDLKATREVLSVREATIKSLEDSILLAQEENKNLLNNLQGEQVRNNSYQNQIQSLSSTVNELYKLSQTDKELLQKYSNIYFLNENYVPSSLNDIDPLYLQRKEKLEKIHSAIKPYLEALLKDAYTNSVPLTVLSAYRSFDTQITLKTSYKVQYGTTAANKFSADQGYSEHQLGSAVDFTTPTNGETLSKFQSSSGHMWLLANAHRYGFILSYPPGNKFYQSEPWHWRFVGVELATKLYTENKHFYDLDQREINEYLIKIFN